jgi:hypothetical protein
VASSHWPCPCRRRRPWCCPCCCRPWCCPCCCRPWCCPCCCRRPCHCRCRRRRHRRHRCRRRRRCRPRPRRRRPSPPHPRSTPTHPSPRARIARRLGRRRGRDGSRRPLGLGGELLLRVFRVTEILRWRSRLALALVAFAHGGSKRERREGSSKEQRRDVKKPEGQQRYL